MAEQIGRHFATPEKPADIIRIEFYYPYQVGEKGKKSKRAGGALYYKYQSLRKLWNKVKAIPSDELLPEGK